MTDTVTIRGNVANDPVRNTTARGDAVINFRLASPQGWFDNRTGAWTEAETNWYDVSAFRQLAEHAKASLRVGDPVIITGKLRVRKWESNGRSGTAVEVEADAIGHDLRRGTSAFAKAHRAPATSARDQADRGPAGGESAVVAGSGTDDRSGDAEDPWSPSVPEVEASVPEGEAEQLDVPELERV